MERDDGWELQFGRPDLRIYTFIGRSAGVLGPRITEVVINHSVMEAYILHIL